MRMYRGMFRQNGNCGYVLKPNYLIDKALVKKPQQPHEVLQKHLKIRIISGQNLPKIGESDSSVVDPYVTVKIEGHLADSFSGRTRVIPNNGFNPTWNEVMEVPLKVPEQAVVCFTVKDKQAIGSSRFIGSYTLPVNCINPGNHPKETFFLETVNIYVLICRISSRSFDVQQWRSTRSCYYFYSYGNQKFRLIPRTIFSFLKLWFLRELCCSLFFIFECD